MSINNISAFKGTSQIQTRNMTAQAKAFAKTDALSNEEERMIGTHFKQASPKVLELYRVTGEARTEQPQSKGLNIDFKV